MRGIDLFLEILSEHGVRHVFGNPGTTELPLNDALVDDPRFRYILGLHEIPVMAMADGYALASGQLGVVNLHASCGLGNAMGMLYNAYRQGTPLMVTAGQQDRRLMFEEPILWGDLVSVASPWTKSAVEVNRIEDLPIAIHRAIQAALTPPTGPVFLALPVDLQLELCAERPGIQSVMVDSGIRPPVQSIRNAAERLASANRPVVLAGSRVAQRRAIAELVAVAEQIGAVVYTEPTTNHGRLGFPPHHPLYVKELPMWSPDIRDVLEPFDAALVCGMDLLRQYIYHEPARAIPERLQVVHLDEDPRELGKNYPIDVALWGETAAGLAELHEAIGQIQSPPQRVAARRRQEAAAAAQSNRRDELNATIAQQASERPLAAAVLMKTIADVLPDNAAVIEAAVTSTGGVLEQLGAIRDPYGYFAQRGWTLGWGLNVTLGAKLAWPDRPVLGLIGDGAALYGIQGLWSAAHHNIPVTWILVNNRNYQILKNCAHQLALPNAARRRYLGLDLVDPTIDFVQLAQSFGVAAQRLTEPDALANALDASWHSPRPQLIEVPVAS